jgi:hypothetical protein
MELNTQCWLSHNTAHQTLSSACPPPFHPLLRESYCTSQDHSYSPVKRLYLVYHNRWNFTCCCMQFILCNNSIFKTNAPTSSSFIYCNFQDLESRYLHHWPQVTTQLPPGVAIRGLLPVYVSFVNDELLVHSSYTYIWICQRIICLASAYK